MNNKLQSCDPSEIALKNFFLGPQAENADFVLSEVQSLLNSWFAWRRSQFPADGYAITEAEKNSPAFQKRTQEFRGHITQLSERFFNEIPKFSPRYIGHMFSEMSLPALLGHIITLLHNPNNISKESSSVGVDIEKEAVRRLCEMVGYPEGAVGHFTSGGTVANFECVLRAKKRWLNQVSAELGEGRDLSILSDAELGRLISKKTGRDFNGPVLLVPESKHYSWVKAAHIFGLGSKNIRGIPLDVRGCADARLLARQIDLCQRDHEPILAVVSVCGTTELGTIDPIHSFQNCLDEIERNRGEKIWHHVDAAYGGFFSTMLGCEPNPLSEVAINALEALKRSTSITIDPHKLGYVPYASGAFLCRERTDYYNHQVVAPYVDFNKQEDSGPYTLEGSRSAAGAVAMFLTAECIGLNEKGYGNILTRTVRSCEAFRKSLEAAELPIQIVETERTNILCFAMGARGMCLSEINAHTHRVIQAIKKFQEESPETSFFISKTILQENFSALIESFCQEHEIQKDDNTLVVIRLTFMNPFISSVHPQVDFQAEFIALLRAAYMI